MLTLYTSIGFLKWNNPIDGKPLPIVVNNNQEYGLSDLELLLWSSLAFQILNIREVEVLYHYRQQRSNFTKDLPLSHFLNRLIVRGLIVEGTGMTAIDALYNLLGALHITPIDNSFSIRFLSCIKLIVKGKLRVKELKHYWKTQENTPLEKTVLKLVQTVQLSAAELVTYIDQGYDNPPPINVLDTLYPATNSTTYQTLSDEVQLCHIQYPVLQAISNLYLKKQILFQKF